MSTQKRASLFILFLLLSLTLTQSITAQSQEVYQSYLPVVTRYLGYRESTGVLDPRFGDDGVVVTSFDRYALVEALALQQDGKILAVGMRDLVRYNPDGSLDTSFDYDGKVLIRYGDGFEGFAVALQQDGKILVAGYVYQTDHGYDFALARFNPDGSPDSAFGTNGLASTDFNSNTDSAYAVVQQPDGKILLGGSAYGGDAPSGTLYDFALARYNPDGSLDESFDNDGKLTADFHQKDDLGYDLALQPDGKILLAGTAYDCPYACFALARYTSEGSLDPSFGNGGWVTADMEDRNDTASAMLLQPDGKVLMAGNSTSAQDDYVPHWAAVRYHPDGALDLGLGVDGKLITRWGYRSEANALALQPDGKIVLAGYMSLTSDTQFALARYTSEGSLDASFAGGGQLITTQNGMAYAMLIQPDGRILIGGYTYDESGYSMALLRFK